jgi:hypothetical protein
VTGGAAVTGGANSGGTVADVGGNAGNAGAKTSRGGAAGASGANTAGVSGGGSTCVYGPFGAPKKLTGLNTTGDIWGPGLSSDNSTLYFHVDDGTTTTIYSASRTDRGTAFVLNGSMSLMGHGTESNPIPSYDGLTLYFVWASPRPSSDDDIYYAKRTSTATQFSNPLALDSVNTTSNESRAWLSRDELTILFESDRSNGKGDTDIWTATRKAKTDDFGTATDLPVVNGTAADESPAMSNDGLALYFVSTRTGASGQKDIWTATRTNTSYNFGTPAPMNDLNSTSVETDLVLSDDGLELFFASDRSGNAQIWRSIRSCQ